MMGGVRYDSGAVLMELLRQEDDRGSTIQTSLPIELESLGVPTVWPYETVSRSHPQVLRGLHHQPGLAKIVYVAVGMVHEVVVDLREESFGAVEDYVLDPERQLYVPPWCAHGYWAGGDGAVVHYRLSGPRDRASEVVIRWDSVGYTWPTTGRPSSAKYMSDKDRDAATLAEVRERLWPHVSEAVEARAT